MLNDAGANGKPQAGAARPTRVVKKGSVTRSRTSSVMPWPSSSTDTRTNSPSGSRAAPMRDPGLAVREGLEGIEDEVDEDLFQLLAIAAHSGQ